MVDFHTILKSIGGPSMEDYLTIAQVALLLQLSDKTIYRLAQSGKLPGFKVGGSWRFRRKDIDAWAASQIRGKRRGAQ